VQHRTEREAAIVSDLVREEFIDAHLASRTKSALIRDMAALAGKTGLVVDPADLLASLIERENLCSTALGGGFALLHPRHHEPYMFADSFVVLAKVGHALPFGAPDGGQTDLFFLACCQDDRIHLHVLARLCLLCTRTELLERLRQADDAATMMAELRTAEAQVTSGAVGA
jgi:PTS system nitrogen regulatory IIA component